MASFFEELWNSVFTPGTTPTLLVATNASFAALQFVLLMLLYATYSIHFLILSILSGGLWYAINWFARELAAQNVANQQDSLRNKRAKSPQSGSDTETDVPDVVLASGRSTISPGTQQSTSEPGQAGTAVAQRHGLKPISASGDSSGYVSTDSEWEKVSEHEK
ncbi:hypothetical protein BT93_L4720 [Corymbia citriodora subsp. variegata]|uniref:Uncharacterized protein n=1 Tax=Corymbia citriodora subsp. variegata TaxID=360336 RepID=A0A8T0CKI5_CORYI|nr:hypothetical protein BT93_L4720 [Corymbia citriodora subsp. variegata]